MIVFVVTDLVFLRINILFSYTIKDALYVINVYLPKNLPKVIHKIYRVKYFSLVKLESKDILKMNDIACMYVFIKVVISNNAF